MTIVYDHALQTHQHHGRQHRLPIACQFAPDQLQQAFVQFVLVDGSHFRVASVQGLFELFCFGHFRAGAQHETQIVSFTFGGKRLESIDGPQRRPGRTDVAGGEIVGRAANRLE